MVFKKETSISTTDSTATFETWIEKPFIPESLKPSLKTSSLLIVPSESIRNIKGPVFPTGTEDLYFYIKEKMSTFNPEICINDEDYREYAFHGILLILGSFVVTAIAAPVLADVISEYVKKRLFKSDDKNDTEVRFEMTVTNEDGSSKLIKYSGPAEQFEFLLIKQVKDLSALKSKAKEKHGPK